MAIRLNAATSRNTSFGLPWSMMAPKISGEIMPPILKPVVTKPNTLPNEPGGVTSRTIMSREGMITPEQKPAADIAATSASEPRSICATSAMNSAIPAKPAVATSPWRVVRTTSTPPILLNLVFFVLLAMLSGGTNNYSVVALGALYGTPVTTANAALSGNLLLSAIGVLIGGVLVVRTTRHGLVATAGLAGISLFIALVAQIDIGSLALVAAMSAAGFCSGVIMPSRDMIVREVTPPGSFGKVFGFATTGFNIGGIISPLIFGAIMDHGSPKLVFLLVAALSPVSYTHLTLPTNREV